jgi:hypothetical protein
MNEAIARVAPAPAIGLLCAQNFGRDFHNVVPVAFRRIGIDEANSRACASCCARRDSLPDLAAHQRSAQATLHFPAIKSAFQHASIVAASFVLREAYATEAVASQHFRSWKTAHRTRHTLAGTHPGIFLAAKKIHGSIDFS